MPSFLISFLGIKVVFKFEHRTIQSKIKKKKKKILYCSPSQNHNSLQDVFKKFEKHPDTSIQRRDFTVIVGDFNVTVWWHIIK